jgi:hypothetical protein
MEIKTKKAAKQAGYSIYRPECDPWLPAEKPSIVKGVEFFKEKIPLYNRTEMSLKGLSLRSKATPVKYIRNRYITYPVYRLEDFIQKRKVTKKEPVIVDILAAIFTINRTAKRYRDAASTCYKKEYHNFARMWKDKKNELYHLKNTGIAYAISNGLITFHSEHGGLILYTGNGYFFHSNLMPEGYTLSQNQDDENIFIEAKNKTKKEARLKDAIYTLQMLTSISDLVGFKTLRINFLKVHDSDSGDNPYDDTEYGNNLF